MGLKFFINYFVLILVFLGSECLGVPCDNNDRTSYVLSNNPKARVLLEKIANGNLSVDITLERPPHLKITSMVISVPTCDLRVKEVLRRYDIFPHDAYHARFPQPVEQNRNYNLRRSFLDNDVTRQYLSYEEMQDYIENMARTLSAVNPNIMVKVRNEGRTYENRKISSVEIKNIAGERKNYVLIDAGIHAREWHSTSMALFLLKKLVDEAKKDRDGLLYRTSIVIIPSVNPDGYEYSRSYSHMWRKNRVPLGDCFGVDGNRNYNVHWEMGDRETQPCEEVYKGPRAFSEAETNAVKKVMQRLKGKTKLYISIHTFGNTILYPYGYTTDRHPREAELLAVATAGVEAARETTGAKFVPDQSGSNLYVAAGGSDDYAMDVIGIPFAYTLELGAEELGFAVPNERLQETLENGWVVIKAMIEKALEM